MTPALQGTAPLVRLALRRDRVMVAAWVAILLVVCFASAASTSSLYADEADRVDAANAINASPGIVALYGPILDVHSEGELAMTKMTVLYAVLVALMTLFVVRRHTRSDEEAGQAELLGGTAIGRDASASAAVVFAWAVSVALGLAAALLNTAAGLPLTGSLAFGASWAGTGLVGSGIALLACQLSASSRTCAAIASSALGALFVLRAVGDSADVQLLSWLSPFGWNTRLRAYGDTRWWVLALYVVTAALLVLAGFAIRRHRDLGSGVVPARPGPTTGSARLRDAMSLELRVHTPMLVGWTVALVALGLVFGAISSSFDAFDSPTVSDMLRRVGGAGAFRDTLIGAVVSVVAVVVSCFAIAVVGHGGADEQDGRTEQVLATATSRARAFLATVALALAGATWLLLVTGIALALGVGGESDRSFLRLAGSALAQAPATWVVVALAVLTLAVSPRWAVAGWGVVVLFASLGQVGQLLDLPGWVIGLSPYAHAPRMPVEPFGPGPALALAACAAGLLWVGWLRYRARDIG